MCDKNGLIALLFLGLSPRGGTFDGGFVSGFESAATASSETHSPAKGVAYVIEALLHFAYMDVLKYNVHCDIKVNM